MERWSAATKVDLSVDLLVVHLVDQKAELSVDLWVLQSVVTTVGPLVEK